MTATKDMWVANLVQPGKGDSSSMPVIEFFESIDEAAEMGKLSSNDKVRQARLEAKRSRDNVLFGAAAIED